MNADEARRAAEDADGKGSYSELRELIYSRIEGQANLGQRKMVTSRTAKFPELAYAALFEELKKDGYQVTPGNVGEMMVISW